MSTRPVVNEWARDSELARWALLHDAEFFLEVRLLGATALGGDVVPFLVDALTRAFEREHARRQLMQELMAGHPATLVVLDEPGTVSR